VPTVKLEVAREKLLEEGNSWEEPPRIVVVVGAGASYAEAKLPLSSKAVSLLKEKIKVEDKFFDYELQRLTTQYRLEEKDFETQLLALSKFHTPDLLKELHNIYGRRYYPTLTYEILAHLLKHRFIDSIVNFNFDELLDQSIDDELGSGSYHRVISDGDYPDEMWRRNDENQRFRLPLYIKPHGTASHKSTMRFTREAYFLLSDDIKNLLEILLSGMPTILIVIGYNMQSVEFNQIISKASDKQPIEIFAINTRELLSLDEKLTQLHKDRLLRLSEDYHVANSLSDLWDHVCLLFKDSLQPRNIMRHELITKLFPGEVDLSRLEKDRHAEVTDYLSDRTYVELALAIAKAKGFVHFNQIAGSRAGRYFEIYKSFSGDQNKSLFHFCEDMGLKQISYSTETLRLKQLPKPEDEGKVLIIGENEFERDCTEQLYLNTRRHLRTLVRAERIKKEKVIFKKTLMELYKGEEVEVNYTNPTAHYRFFSSPTVLNTLTAFSVHTLDLLSQEWDLLLCVAESAEWLVKEEIWGAINKQPGRKLALIVADLAWKEKIIGKFGNETFFDILQLPWWLHNQHMTILMKKNHDLQVRPFFPVGGMFFERRLRGTNINPVVLSEESDCNIALHTFFAYWVKAKRQRENSSIGFLSRNEVETEQKEMLQQVHRSMDGI
jgi:hypothetical protein